MLESEDLTKNITSGASASDASDDSMEKDIHAGEAELDEGTPKTSMADKIALFERTGSIRLRGGPRRKTGSKPSKKDEEPTS